jgi:hypothetical protein
MKTIRLGNLPLLVRIAKWMAFFASWILFEETIVDRHGLWRYMAQYQVGNPCYGIRGWRSRSRSD